MATMQWDVEHLRDLAREHSETALEKQREADWLTAQCSAERKICEDGHGPLYCPSKKCRRARQCLWRLPICAPLLVFQVTPERRQKLTREFYTQIQQQRRAAVTGDRGKL